MSSGLMQLGRLSCAESGTGEAFGCGCVGVGVGPFPSWLLVFSGRPHLESQVVFSPCGASWPGPKVSPSLLQRHCAFQGVSLVCRHRSSATFHWPTQNTNRKGLLRFICSLPSNSARSQSIMILVETLGSKELYLKRCLNIKRGSKWGWRVCHSNFRENKQCHVCATVLKAKYWGGKKEVDVLV